MSAMPTSDKYGKRMGFMHKSGYSAVAEYIWNGVDAQATQIFVNAGPMLLPSGASIECVSVLENGRGMTEAAMSNSLLMIGQGEGQPHGFHSLNGHGAKKACEHLGRETLYLSKTEDGWTAGRMGAGTNELSAVGQMTRMTLQRCSLDAVSALHPGEPIFYNNPFCANGPQLRALFEQIESPTGTLVLVGHHHPNRGFKLNEAGRLLDMERDWAALRASHLPKAAAAAMDLPDLLSRATAPVCLYPRLRELGFVAGAAPGVGVDVYVNDELVDVVRLNPFDAAVAAAGKQPAIVLSDCGRFAFAAVWPADRDTAEAGLTVLTDGKNLGLFPGNGGNRTFGVGTAGLSGMPYLEISANIWNSKCEALAKQAEGVGAKAGLALEAMKAYAVDAANERKKQLHLYQMFSGQGLLCFLAAKQGVLQSDDPKEGCLEDNEYRAAMAFVVQQILRFTMANPAPEATIKKLLAPFAQYGKFTIEEVHEHKRVLAANKAAANALARREKAEREAAETAVRNAAARQKAESDKAAAKLQADREEAARKLKREQKAAEKKRKQAIKAAEDAARDAEEKAKLERERQARERERQARERERQERAEALARERKVLAELAASTAEMEEMKLQLAALTAPDGRGRPRDEDKPSPDDKPGNGAARGAPRPRLAACADCTAHAKAAADKDAYIARLQAFIRDNGLQVPRV